MSKYERKERKDSLVLYHDIVDDLDDLRDLCGYEAVGKLFLAIMHYSRDDIIPSFSREELTIQIFFNRIKRAVELANASWSKRCAQNAINASKRNKNSKEGSQFINSETGEVIESDMSQKNDALGDDSAIPTEKMILDYFVKEKGKPITSNQAKNCREYCIIYKDECDSWKENADSWVIDNL